uniref:Candidate secreted effector n=1 Tax=Meloidogyne incognita TaxID=6306 RepID=A0A914ND64_MELIC
MHFSSIMILQTSFMIHNVQLSATSFTNTQTLQHSWIYTFHFSQARVFSSSIRPPSSITRLIRLYALHYREPQFGLKQLQFAHSLQISFGSEN